MLPELLASASAGPAVKELSKCLLIPFQQLVYARWTLRSVLGVESIRNALETSVAEGGMDLPWAVISLI